MKPVREKHRTVCVSTHHKVNRGEKKEEDKEILYIQNLLPKGDKLTTGRAENSSTETRRRTSAIPEDICTNISVSRREGQANIPDLFPFYNLMPHPSSHLVSAPPCAQKWLLTHRACLRCIERHCIDCTFPFCNHRSTTQTRQRFASFIRTFKGSSLQPEAELQSGELCSVK
ncbi:hypothetical protein PROFUN_13091 [Planoprotostelium fungivorum]|uniref:Uncharacterized protein n=1 Tax=Planoprotostelium fungivorum TaxID=1890364 RepID=A0A2P6N5B5_9EUKA|nr:hypothetical protein PROFUN_13091 [Planoprotostelium fungivorum]